MKQAFRFYCVMWILFSICGLAVVAMPCHAKTKVKFRLLIATRSLETRHCLLATHKQPQKSRSHLISMVYT